MDWLHWSCEPGSLTLLSCCLRREKEEVGQGGLQLTGRPKQVGSFVPNRLHSTGTTNSGLGLKGHLDCDNRLTRKSPYLGLKCTRLEAIFPGIYGLAILQLQLVRFSDRIWLDKQGKYTSALSRFASWSKYCFRWSSP